jgi:hypothetical protein
MLPAAGAPAARAQPAGPYAPPAAEPRGVVWLEDAQGLEALHQHALAAGGAVGLAVHAPGKASADGTGLVLAMYAAATAQADAGQGGGGQGPCVYLLRASQLLGPGGSAGAAAALRGLLEAEDVTKFVYAREQVSPLTQACILAFV